MTSKRNICIFVMWCNINAHFSILPPSSNVQAQFVAKGRVTTSILFCLLDFNKIRREAKGCLKGKNEVHLNYYYYYLFSSGICGTPNNRKIKPIHNENWYSLIWFLQKIVPLLWVFYHKFWKHSRPWGHAEPSHSGLKTCPRSRPGSCFPLRPQRKPQRSSDERGCPEREHQYFNNSLIQQFSAVNQAELWTVACWTWWLSRAWFYVFVRFISRVFVWFLFLERELKYAIKLSQFGIMNN